MNTENKQTLEQTLDALAAEGRVRRMAECDCADLPAWADRRREADSNVRFFAAAVCLALLLTVPTHAVVAQQLPPERMNVSHGSDRAQIIAVGTQIVEAL